MKKISTLLLFLSMFALSARNVDQWNLGADRLAVKGYDVVSIFNGDVSEGTEEFEIEHDGAVYRFKNQKNLDQFLSNTDKYEPAHGGWCSTAIAFGQKIDVNPEKFVIKGDRLFLFSFLNGNDARVMWNNDPARLERRADFNWRRTSGEEPRGL